MPATMNNEDMQFAKARFTAACAAYLRDEPGAIEKCTEALHQITAAQAEIETDQSLDELATEIGEALDAMDPADAQALADTLVRELDAIGGDDGDDLDAARVRLLAMLDDPAP